MEQEDRTEISCLSCHSSVQVGYVYNACACQTTRTRYGNFMRRHRCDIYLYICLAPNVLASIDTVSTESVRFHPLMKKRKFVDYFTLFTQFMDLCQSPDSEITIRPKCNPDNPNICTSWGFRVQCLFSLILEFTEQTYNTIYYAHGRFNLFLISWRTQSLADAFTKPKLYSLIIT